MKILITYNKENKFKQMLKFITISIVLLLVSNTQSWAANETFNPGANIIDMGSSSQSINNGLKPYGLVYELIMEYNVPVRWAIHPNKTNRNNPDFFAGSDSYGGGSFIIPVEHISTEVQAVLDSWESGGVIVDEIGISFTAPIYKVLTTWPRAILDLKNGVKIAKPYFTRAGIPSDAYVTAGNPTMLTDCGDIYILPHAEPDEWAQSWKTALINYVNGGGYLWSGCHAASALEGGVTDANFLSENGLLRTNQHSDGNNNYTYDPAYSADPIMQFIGTFDNAINKGSEQIYMPAKGNDWNSTTKIAVYQPSHPQADPNEAAVLVYGRAFGDDNKGMVMYEAGHRLDEVGTTAEQVAAQRAFFNFILMAGVDKEISVTSTVPSFVVSESTIDVSASGSEGTGSYTYEWTSSCDGGYFDDPNSSSTTYHAPFTGDDNFTCTITVKVTDFCNRFTYKATVVNVGPADGPDAIDDDRTTPMNTPIDIVVLSNDTEGDAAIDETTVSFVSSQPPTNQGAFTVHPTTGVVTFTPANGFTGTVTIDYEVCDDNSLCDEATITVVITPVIADLEVIKIADLSALKPGETLTYTITVNNNGPDDASNVVLNDVIPTKLNLVSATPTQGSWSAPTWTIGSLANGASVSMTVIATVKSNADGNIVNTAVVSSSTDDPDESNNTSTVTVDITDLVGPDAIDDSTTTPMNTPVDIDVLDNDTEGDAALNPSSVSFIGGTEPNPTTEGTFTYNEITELVTFTPVTGFTGDDVTIDYEVCDLNSLCDIATITVDITLVIGPDAIDDNATTKMNTPVDIDVLDNDVDGDTAIDPTTVTFTGTAPNPTNEGTFTVDGTTGLVTFTPVDGYTGTVYIDYEVCDLNDLCDIATITVIITELVADLQILKIGTPNPAIAGQALTYTITVTNNGPDDAEDVVVNDVLPNKLIFNGASPSSGSWNAPVWTIGDLANEAVVTLTITTTVKENAEGNIVNTAIVSSSTDDPDESNNTSTSTIPIDDIPDIVNYFHGTLAYEDLWPGKGDYDFNDLVLDYEFEIESNTTNHVSQVTATFIIEAFGAGLENGFGFQLSEIIDANDLVVTGFELTENYISLANNGTENNQSKPTIIVYDNAYNQMQHPGSGIGVNTDPFAPYVTPDTLQINITFPANTYTLNDLDIANFNPFLIVGLTRGHEVHLPDYIPTDLVDESLFGTYEDDSDPGSGRYYRTVSNLPWAINIYETFDYPIEKREISTAYLKFIEWAESAGDLSQNWYEDLSGYRNDANIY